MAECALAGGCITVIVVVAVAGRDVPTIVIYAADVVVIQVMI